MLSNDPLADDRCSRHIQIWFVNVLSDASVSKKGKMSRGKGENKGMYVCHAPTFVAT